MSGRKKSSAATTENDAVDQLLQAAQDEMLLELSVDSHMSRVAPDYLNPDLRRRFQALRSRPSSSHSQQKKQSSAPPPSPPKPQPEQKEDEEKKDRKSKVVVPDNVDEELKAVLGDGLSARFAALKASLSSSSSNPTAATSISTNEVRIGLEKSDGEDDEEDEVERVIQWAKDAARLDPSPASDEDDDDLIGSDSDDKDSDYDDDPKHKKRNQNLGNEGLLKEQPCSNNPLPSLKLLILFLSNMFMFRLDAVNTFSRVVHYQPDYSNKSSHNGTMHDYT